MADDERERWGEPERLDTASDAETRRLGESEGDDEPVAGGSHEASSEPTFVGSESEAPTRRVDGGTGTNSPLNERDAETHRLGEDDAQPHSLGEDDVETHRLGEDDAASQRLAATNERETRVERTQRVERVPAAAVPRSSERREPAVWQDEHESARDRRPAKTSAAAFFGFLFGFSSLITAFLGPVAVIFGILGLICGVAGRRRAEDEARVSGRVVATTGVVLAVIGLLLGLAVTIAGALYVNDPSVRDAISGAWSSVRDAFTSLPTFGL